MVSREEAHRELNGEGHLMVARAIDKIYESIGSCGECSWFVQNRKTNGWCSNNETLEPSSDWFCADFERKKDDTKQ